MVIPEDFNENESPVIINITGEFHQTAPIPQEDKDNGK